MNLYLLSGTIIASFVAGAADASDWQSQRLSPASGAAGPSLNWQGVSGQPVSISVALPRANGSISLSPHPGPRDSEFAGAIARFKSGGTIHLQPGTYEISKAPSQDDGAIVITGVSDLRIDGAEATIVFDHPGDGIRISGSQRVAISGVTLRYAQPGIVLGQLSGGPNGTVLTLDKPIKAGGTPLQISEVKEFDRVRGNSPPSAQRQFFGKVGLALAPSINGGYQVPAVQGFTPGSSVAVKLGYYNGSAVHIVDVSGMPRSNDISLDHVTIANSSGMGIVADRMGRGLAIVHSTIGPATPGDGAVSIPFDGIHIGAAAGDILLDQDQISGTSDDAINIATPMADVVTASGTTLTVKGYAGLIEAGGRLTLLDNDMQPLWSGIVLKRGPLASNGSGIVQVSTVVPGNARYATLDNFSASRFAVVRSNIGHCACRGILAQGLNGLIADNHFSDTTSNPIRVLGSAFWKEGGGSKNVVITRNIIDRPGVDKPRDLIWGVISVYSEASTGGSKPQVRLASAPVNDLIAISGNVIHDAQQACISVATASRVTISANTCTQISRATKPVASGQGWADDVADMSRNVMHDAQQACVSAATESGISVLINTCEQLSRASGPTPPGAGWTEVRRGIWVDRSTTKAITF